MRFFTIFCLSLWIFSPKFLAAQITLQGRILEEASQQGIEAVHVFIANTTIGVFTDEEGYFLLEQVPVGKQQIIFSHISYETQIKIIQIVETQAYRLNVSLKRTAQDLATVEVSAKQSKKWRKDLKKFSQAFFGESPNASRCQILNPTVLELTTSKEGSLLAHASDLLEIENRALGYRLYFLLEHFEAKGAEVSYAGKPLFVPLEPENEKEARRWEKQRALAYRGSMRHFFRSLIRDELGEEGFEYFLAQLKPEGGFLIGNEPDRAQLLQQGNHPMERLLNFDNFLKIVYRREKDKITVAMGGIGSAGDLGHQTEQDMANDGSGNSRVNPQNQVSYLFARSAQISLDTSGILLRPERIVEYGYWSYERVADMLPLGYASGATNKPKVQMTAIAPQRKGFVLDGLLLPLHEIKDGGPPKDGIPSIDFPKFLAPEEAAFLQADDYVLGLHLNGVATAYPIRILNYHEVVNDRFGNQPVVISYCPLCGSGVAFKAGTAQKEQTFGVSGLLYNSDVLLYDRETESLWSQLLGKAISGPLSGTTLGLLPIEHTTWEDWKSRYPETMVLSDDTGFTRDYKRTPYGGYEKSSELLFPVSKKNKDWPLKEKVLGVEVRGVYKAYPFSRLQKATLPIRDNINGEELFIYFDKTAKAARATTLDGETYAATTLYWFAWYAFHPYTKVY